MAGEISPAVKTGTFALGGSTVARVDILEDAFDLIYVYLDWIYVSSSSLDESDERWKDEEGDRGEEGGGSNDCWGADADMDEVEGTCEACQVFLTHVAMTRLSRISSCWAEADVHVNHSGSRIAEVWAVDEW